MTDRISIPALRESLTQPVLVIGTLEPAWVPPAPSTLLALVEAVEAAQVYYAGDGTPGTYTRHKVRQRLADALARFDFGEDASEAVEYRRIHGHYPGEPHNA